MIKFDPKDMRVVYHFVTNITPYPMVTTVDPETGAKRKFRISKSLYHAYVRQYKLTWFPDSEPHRMAFLVYKDNVVDIEPSPLFAKIDREVLQEQYDINVRERQLAWKSPMETNFAEMVELGHFDHSWYDFHFDGSYIYAVRKNLDGFQAVDKDERFFRARVESVAIQKLKDPHFIWDRGRNKARTVTTVYRLVMAYKVNKRVCISPTLTKGSLKEVEWQLASISKDLMDRVNERYHVNVDFVLEAAKVVRSLYGYHSLAFLRLPQIMTTLKVSTLKGIDKAIRRLTPVGLDLKSTVAWLLGFMQREADYEKSVKLFNLFAYLFAKGVIYEPPKHILSDLAPGRVNAEQPPLINPQQYIEAMVANGFNWERAHDKEYRGFGDFVIPVSTEAGDEPRPGQGPASVTAFAI